MNKLLFIFLLISTHSVLAHPGHGDSLSFQSGLLHPFTGLDHLLLLLGTGFVAAMNKKVLTLPLITLGSMFTSTVMRSFFTIASLDFFILMSLVIIGMTLLIKSTRSLCTWFIPIFALAHGAIHGGDIKLQSFWVFIIGIMFSNIILLYIGVQIGTYFRSNDIMCKFFGIGIILISIFY